MSARQRRSRPRCIRDVVGALPGSRGHLPRRRGCRRRAAGAAVRDEMLIGLGAPRAGSAFSADERPTESVCVLEGVGDPAVQSISRDTPCGSDFGETLEAAGWQAGAGENIAWGASLARTPRVLVDGWLHSDGHRDNLFPNHLDGARTGSSLRRQVSGRRPRCHLGSSVRRIVAGAAEPNPPPSQVVTEADPSV